MISVEIKGVKLQFETDPSNFSPHHIDAGTLAMLSAVEFTQKDKVLDLGCGYGVVGILAGKLIGEEKVVLCDYSECAVTQARLNAKRNGLPGLDVRLSDGFQSVPENDWTLILSNPPYHTDFSVAKQFIEGGFRRLVSGGKLVMVTKRLDWYKNKLISVFGGVKVREIEGYYVFTAEKRGDPVRKKEKKTHTLSKKLQRKQRKRTGAASGLDLKKHSMKSSNREKPGAGLRAGKDG